MPVEGPRCLCHWAPTMHRDIVIPGALVSPAVKSALARLLEVTYRNSPSNLPMGLLQQKYCPIFHKKRHKFEQCRAMWIQRWRQRMHTGNGDTDSTAISPADIHCLQFGRLLSQRGSSNYPHFNKKNVFLP